jgi:hypothetical protein
MMSEHIKISRGQIIEQLSESMFDDLEMNPDYLTLIIAEGFMGYNHYTTEDLLYEYREYISEDPNYNVTIEIVED